MICMDCHGTGKQTCPTCFGRGYMASDTRDWLRTRSYNVECITCGSVLLRPYPPNKGTGKIDCPKCHGKGIIEKLFN